MEAVHVEAGSGPGGLAEPTDVDPPAPVRDAWTLYSPGRRWVLLTILFLATLCSMTDRYLMSVLLEPIKAEFHANDTVMGLLTGFAFAAFYAVLGLPIARWADRGDRRLIISASLAVWSVMSALCGVVKSLPLLALARIGVGVGEAGAQPPVMSLIPDYYPPQNRARAVAAIVLSSVFGILIAYTLGARIAAHQGWRAAFIWLSLPGLPLAVLSFFLLSEPRKALGHTVAAAHERLGATVAALVRKRSLVFALTGSAIYSLVVAGAFLWIPAYMQRVLKVDLAGEGALYGVIGMVTPFVGTSIGGWLTDRLTRRSITWLGWLPALGIAAALPLYEIMLYTKSYPVMLVFSLSSTLPLSIAVPAISMLILTVSGAKRRSLSMAVNGLLASLIGVGGGSLATGMLSDALTPSLGIEALRYALMLVTATLLPCALLFAAAARSIPKDAEP